MSAESNRVARPVPRGARRSFGIPLGRIGGIPVVLSLSWLISVLIVAILATPVVEQAIPGITTGPAVAVAVGLGVLLGVSVLAHELGHCLAARSLGVPVLEVRLYLLGGVSELGRLPNTPKEEAVIAAAGPGVSFILAGVFGLLIGSTTPHTVTWLLLIELALANLVVAIFNVLPALPLDGGRVLRAGVWQASGRRRLGTLSAVAGGYLIAVALIVWGIVEVAGSTKAAVLQGGIAVVMALFVGVGAASEQNSDRAVKWPADVTIAGLARAVVQLPTESPVQLANQVAAGRAVILTGTDGVAVGLMDEQAAINLARTQPQAPATMVAEPITPEMVILSHDEPADVAARLRTVRSRHFLLVDDDGRPAGVVLSADIARILSGRRRR
ncbi:Zn-dependent protease (includes SpoIVFB) [Nakamurella panacisegetis]|uniref:Zinc metalloprotease n=1 Tax=Nakamurella panacisegetis TaxID=1090615 RepID=A0A1H0RR40_9ACTN|nr:site-2 protease family protein [Nakamurella panacisegetis]SDP31982.1 Zn-dependent protease (includes SpoIVFB) [Nakamurella panacisegetis]